MSGIFGGDSSLPFTPANNFAQPAAGDSAATKLVDAEQQRTEAQRIDSIQRQLRLDTAAGTRGYGLRSLFGSLGTQRNSLLGSG